MTKKIFKTILTILVFAILAFGFYIYKLRTLALEGNKLFGYRCTHVNIPLINYKNNFLKQAEYLNGSKKYTLDEVTGFIREYISEMRKYVKEEEIWLKMDKKYINRWDFKLFQPWYIKQLADYQYKMYEAYRDDAQYMLKIFDEKLTLEQIGTDTPEPRQRRDKYVELFYGFFDDKPSFNDWRTIIQKLPLPQECNSENTIIPDTSGSIDWDSLNGTPTPTPIRIPLYPELST